MRTRTAKTILLVALCGALLSPLQAADPEDELKAATVLAFLQHAQWQDGAAPGQLLRVGVTGRPAFATVLRRTLENKPVNGRVVKVFEAGSADAHCCEVMYFGGDRKAEIQQALTGAAHALTIGETARFLEYGGAVNLFLSDGHMAFEVNLEALGRSGVTISSRLLRFGRIRGAGSGRVTP